MCILTIGTGDTTITKIYKTHCPPEVYTLSWGTPMEIIQYVRSWVLWRKVKVRGNERGKREQSEIL